MDPSSAIASFAPPFDTAFTGFRTVHLTELVTEASHSSCCLVSSGVEASNTFFKSSIFASKESTKTFCSAEGNAMRVPKSLPPYKPFSVMSAKNASML